MYEVTQKLQFYTFFYPLNVLIPSSCSQQCNGLTIFWLAEKTRLKTPIKRSKIKLLYLLAPSLFLLNRANCSACADKFPTCSLKRIIPEPSFPSRGSQARGTRLLQTWSPDDLPISCPPLTCERACSGNEIDDLRI